MTTQLEHTINDLHRAANTICDAWGRLQFENPPDSYVQSNTTGHARRTGRPSDPTANAALRYALAASWLSEMHSVIEGDNTHIGIAKAANIQITTWGIEPTRRALHAAIEDLHLKHGWKIDDLIDLDPQSPNYRRDVFGLERLADTYGEWKPRLFPNGPHDGGTNTPITDDTPEDCGLCGMPTAPGRNPNGQLQTRRINGQAFHATAGYGHGACYWTVWRQRRSAA